MNEMARTDRDTQLVALITAIQMPLLVYVRSLLPGDPAARDVAQQANAKIWEKRDEFELGTHFRAWAFSIARYEVLNYRKKQARDSKITFSEELQHTMSTELAAVEDDLQEQHEALRSCLQKLHPEQRDLLLHRYANAGTLADYAAQVGRSVGGLKVTLHRLRTALQECIESNMISGRILS
ncbi:MAG: sigma-70 family RNA polymerase sigma factor [Fuerstiella sp.]